MTHITAFVRLTTLMILALAFGAHALAQDTAPKLDEYLREITKQGRFTGSALVARDGKVIFSKGYGLARN